MDKILGIFPKIQPNNYGTYERGVQGIQPASQNPWAGAVSEPIDAFPAESMEYLNTASSGSVYKNGLGHSDFGLMKPYLA